MLSSACHATAVVAPVAATGAAARPGGFVYCACHAKCSAALAAGATRAEARPGSSVCCACCACHRRRRSPKRLCVLRLLRGCLRSSKSLFVLRPPHEKDPHRSCRTIYVLRLARERKPRRDYVSDE